MTRPRRGDGRVTRLHYVGCTGGRLGNQLLAAAHLLAFALDEREAGRPVEIVQLPLLRYAPLLARAELDPLLRIPGPLRPAAPPSARLVRAWASRVGGQKAKVPEKLYVPWVKATKGRRFLDLRARADRLPLDGDEFGGFLGRGGDRWSCGFGLRAWGLLRRRRAEVADWLAFRDVHRRPAGQLLGRLRARIGGGKLVGLVLRQGDYAGYLGGRWHHPSARYAGWGRQLVERFGPDTHLLIVSDDPQEPATFDGLPFTFGTGAAVGPGHYLENLVALAGCDLIVSVPSTFGALASFYGGVPLMTIDGPDTDLATQPEMAGGLFDAARDPTFGLTCR